MLSELDSKELLRYLCLQSDTEHSLRIERLVSASELNLFSVLKPRIFKDGDRWCVLYGENLQDGVCGFGDTPMKALYAWNVAWSVKAIAKAEGR